MRIQIQSHQFTASQHLLEFIQKKVAKLEQFFDRIIGVEVFLSLDNKASHVKDKIVKIKLDLPGSQIIATESSKLFEESVDLSVDSVRRQLKRHKEKIRR